MKLNKADIIFVAAVIAVIAASITLKIRSTYAQQRAAAEEPAARVFVDNKLFGEYCLKRDAAIRLPSATLEIESGRIAVTGTDCRNRICQHKAVSKPGESIICMPKRIFVEITGRAPEADALSS